ncbi:hypothetical protein [Streptomyces sp. NPDC046870]|uniref:hypothetical protein n=1 Tax=Streptomyces sp. NPDC046870 TaxID=3155135 RepID=UPI003453114B
MGRYQPDLAAAFRHEQEAEPARDDHGFPGRTVEELWRDEEWMEYVYTGGTASVLDQSVMVAATGTGGGPYMRPLTDAEVRAWAPDGRPTHAVWRAALDADRLPFPDRACGNCTVLYDGNGPAGIAYRGVTAD